MCKHRAPLASPHGGTGGFTLIEAAISLAILSGVVIAVLTSLNYHLSAVDRIKYSASAAMLAREKVEEINLKGLPRSEGGDFAPDFAAYRWKYRTEDLGFHGIKKVYVTVSRGADSVTVETYRTTN